MNWAALYFWYFTVLVYTCDIRQQGGSFYLFYDDEEEKWVDTMFFFGATIFNRLENDNSNYCVDSYSNW